MGYFPSLYSVAKVFGGILLVSLASTAGLLYRYQTSLIYAASFPPGSRAEVATPDEFDIPYIEHELTTPDGERLRVFAMLQGHRLAEPKPRPQPGPKAQQPAPSPTGNRRSSPTEVGYAAVEVNDAKLATARPTILFLHANAGNMGHRLPLAAVLFKRFGCNVVMLSYRGYGFSTGSPNERGIRIDAQTALDWIRKHPQLGKTLVVAYGQSIGGAVAVDLASRNPKSVHALMLENTFLSIPELIPHVLPPVRPFAFLCREFWSSSLAITKIAPSVPVLFLSGRKDELVPPSHMDALYEKCRSTNKVWKAFEDGTHNDTCVKPKYFETISEFLLTHVVPRLHEVHGSGGRTGSGATSAAAAATTTATSSISSSASAKAKDGSETPKARAVSPGPAPPAPAAVPASPTLGSNAAGRDGSEDGDEWVKMSESDVLEAEKAGEQLQSAGGMGGKAPASAGEVVRAVARAERDEAEDEARRERVEL
ncbi:bem46 protein, variant [Thecaphora frezii]